jgi:Spy/CpxP family protein refolding chaperone
MTRSTSALFVAAMLTPAAALFAQTTNPDQAKPSEPILVLEKFVTEDKGGAQRRRLNGWEH